MDCYRSATVVETETEEVVIAAVAQSTRVEVRGGEGEASARRSVAASCCGLEAGGFSFDKGDILSRMATKGLGGGRDGGLVRV